MSTAQLTASALVPPSWRRVAEPLCATEPGLARALASHDASPHTPERARAVLLYLARFEPASVRELLGDLPVEERDLARAVVLARSGAVEQAIAELDFVAAQARAAGDVDRLLWALSDLGRALCILGEANEGVAALEEARIMAQLVGDAEREGWILLTLGFVEGERHRAQEYASRTSEAIALLRQVGEPRGLAHGLCNLAGALQTLGEHERAEAAYDEALSLSRTYGWAYFEALALAGRGGLAYRRGELEAGSAGYLESEAILEQLGNRHQVAYHALMVSRYELQAGRLERALSSVERCLGMTASLGRPQITSQALGIRAAVLAALGRHAEAYQARCDQVELLESSSADRRANASRVAADRQRGLEARIEVRAERGLRQELEKRNAELQAALEIQRQLRERLELLSHTDPLTELHNRRHLDAELRKELSRALRRWRPLSVILLDLDRFKSVNDTYGHAAGDAVLVEVARRLRVRLRATDVIARWGGEEICIALPDTDLDGAAKVADDLRVGLAEAPVDTPAGPIRVTASFGVTTLPPESSTLEALLARADRALYAAKAAGRDRVVASAD